MRASAAWWAEKGDSGVATAGPPSARAISASREGQRGESGGNEAMGLSPRRGGTGGAGRAQLRLPALRRVYMFLEADLSPRMHLLPGAAVANCHKFGDSLSSRRPGDRNRDSARSASRAAASGGSGGGSSSASSSSWGLRPLPRHRGALSSVSAVPCEAPGRGTESTIRDEPPFPLGIPDRGSTRDSARVGGVQGVGLTHGYSAERPLPAHAPARCTAAASFAG